MSVDIHSLLGFTNDVSRSLVNAKIVFFDRNCQFVIAPLDVEHSVYCLLSKRFLITRSCLLLACLFLSLFVSLLVYVFV